MKFKINLPILMVVVGLTSYTPKEANSRFFQDSFSNQNISSGFIKFDEQCFSSQEDYAIYAASQAEEKALDTLFTISPDMEKEVSEKIHSQAEYTFVEDGRTEKLREMLAKMEPNAGRKDIDYKVFLIEDKAINAWTILGGYIYFTTAIMDYAQSDDEIAFILGHEIGHNEHKHTHKHIQRNAPLTMLFGNKANIITNLWSKTTVAFNHHQELESDRVGIQLAQKIGYDPVKGLEFWKRRAQEESENRLAKLFRTHPYSSERYQCGIDFLEDK